MTSAIVKSEPEHTALAISSAPVFTPQQERMILDAFASGASREEAAVLMEIARARRLNPLLKQIHFVKRRDNQKGRDVWSAQVSIDGLRAIAERTGKYDGQDEPDFGPPNADGYPEWAKVRVYRKDWSRPAVGMAYWTEYAQSTRDGVSRFWRAMPRVMLAKCAESVAMRKAFPDDMSGLYTAEEMMQGDAPELPRVTPHDDGTFAKLTELMAHADNMNAEVGESFERACELRAYLGSAAKQSELTKAIQAAKEARLITPDQHKELSKNWQRLNRACAKLETELDPGSLSEHLQEPKP